MFEKKVLKKSVREKSFLYGDVDIGDVNGHFWKDSPVSVSFSFL